MPNLVHSVIALISVLNLISWYTVQAVHNTIHMFIDLMASFEESHFSYTQRPNLPVDRVEIWARC